MRQSLGEVAIVGTGLVGCGWSVAYALGGASVRLYDREPGAAEAAFARIGTMLADMQRAGLADHTDAALKRVRVAQTLADALNGVDYVQESVFERVDVKVEVAKQIGALISDDTVVGSSSSGLPASSFTENAPKRERFLIAHPVNPPHLVPVVELVPTPWTDPQIVPWLRERLTEIGKVPVEVRREIDGFILNRLQGALLNEAWGLYEEGYASAADIDATVSQGLGLRWSFMGPFETIDLNAPGGVADYASRLAPLYHRIAVSRTERKEWSPELVAKIAAERRAALPLEDIPARSQWRDRRLMQLVAHRRAQEKKD
ncbi:MAG TPA: 3-hydroxyacyl-CoA dehydrogenase [Devosia sp.]|nr:3-hydroxyacyl-CoA dehydrogenase [Devosia sp.]